MTAGVGFKPLDMFSMGIRALNRDNKEACEAFRMAVQADSMLCDAWLGRLAAGESAIDVVAGAYNARAQLGVALNSVRMRPEDLKITTKLTLDALDLGMPTHTRMHLAIAYAVSLAESATPQLGKANDLLERASGEQNLSSTESDLLDYVKLGLLGLAQRWPDVLAAAAEQRWRTDAQDFVRILNIGTLVWKVRALIGTGSPEEALRLIDSGLAMPGMLTDASIRLSMARGYALRALGRRDEAQQAFAEVKARVASPEAAAALDDHEKTIEIVTAASLATRSDLWDPTSGKSASALEAAERDNRREHVRAEAMAMLDKQIGMGMVKEQIKRLQAKALMDQRRAEMGIAAKEIGGAYIFVGPPGTGKTTMARVLAKLLFGLGVISRPEVVEASRPQMVDQYLGKTAMKTNAVIDKALGGLLFIDEVYSLYQQGYSGGDPYGQEALDTLNTRMENERKTSDPSKKLVTVVAGYEADVSRVLGVNEGLKSRFTTRITFQSYTPEELVSIADLMASGESALYSADALDMLGRYVTQLASTNVEQRDQSGTPLRTVSGVNAAGNARFIRSVTEKATEIRDFRLLEAADADVTKAALVTIEASDLDMAFREQCAVQEVPFQ